MVQGAPAEMIAPISWFKSYGIAIKVADIGDSVEVKKALRKVEKGLLIKAGKAALSQKHCIIPDSIEFRVKGPWAGDRPQFSVIAARINSIRFEKNLKRAKKEYGNLLAKTKSPAREFYATLLAHRASESHN